MGLPYGLLQLLIDVQARQHFTGPLLTLGVQDVYATYDQLIELLDRTGLAYRPVPPAERKPSSSVRIRELGLESEGFVHSTTLFRLLGFSEIETLDASTCESPTLVHDLNQPVPLAWHGRYGLVLDGGTVEHIFDLKTTFSNLVRLCRVGGSIIHFSPLAGWLNHGFYQPSPCLFYDFYEANGFRVTEAFVLALGPGPLDPIRLQKYEHTLNRLKIRRSSADSEGLYNLLFVATKEQAFREIQIPTQGKYRPRMAAPVAPAARQTALAI